MSIIFIVLLALAAADNEVFVLTDTNFEETLGSGKPMFVKFFAPWCGHCKRLAPAYIDLAKAVKESDKDIIIAELDCTVHKSMASKYSIKGYPTLILFENEEETRYKGDRSVKDMTEFLDNNIKNMQFKRKTGTKPDENKSKLNTSNTNATAIPKPKSNKEETEFIINYGRYIIGMLLLIGGVFFPLIYMAMHRKGTFETP